MPKVAEFHTIPTAPKTPSDVNPIAPKQTKSHVPCDQEEEDQPFVQVTSKRVRRKQHHANYSSATAIQKSCPRFVDPRAVHPIDTDNIKRKITESQLELTASAFYRSALELLRNKLPSPPVDIICFGIGAFADCYIARTQLAFILAIRADLQPDARLLFHEPLLSADERLILEQLNCTVHPSNVEGKHRLSAAHHSLVFLPHCPKQLTNNLLWANWQPAALRNCTLLCNSFQLLCDSTPVRFLRTDAHYIVAAHSFTDEHPLANTFRPREIFNDTSLHTFRPTDDDIDDAADAAIEPVYPPGASELICSAFETLTVSDEP